MPAHDVIEEVLATLTPREQRVLQLRFGLEDGRSRTLEEVGKEFNVNSEQIRRTETLAIRKLRHPSRSGRLKSLIEPDISVTPAEINLIRVVCGV